MILHQCFIFCYLLGHHIFIYAVTLKNESIVDSGQRAVSLRVEQEGINLVFQAHVAKDNTVLQREGWSRCVVMYGERPCNSAETVREQSAHLYNGTL